MNKKIRTFIVANTDKEVAVSIVKDILGRLPIVRSVDRQTKILIYEANFFVDRFVQYKLRRNLGLITKL